MLHNKPRLKQYFLHLIIDIEYGGEGFHRKTMGLCPTWEPKIISFHLINILRCVIFLSVSGLNDGQMIKKMNEY